MKDTAALNCRASVQAGYISETLYHFLPSDLKIFASIIEKGLLCSIGNMGRLDRYSVTLRGRGVEEFDVWQHPRICFTDIPRTNLQVHAAKYGKIGLGFARETILRWGGAPVWYLNNHPSLDGTADTGAIVYGLSRFSNLAAVLISRIRLHGEALVFESGRRMQGQEAEQYVRFALSSLYQALSFTKEIAPIDKDSQEYLYEREWRIVADARDAFRSPTAAERQALIEQNPAWGQPPHTVDPDILARFGSRPMVDQFVFFQGEPGVRSVSEAIEVVLVPDADMKSRVTRFIEQNPNAFRAGGPEVDIFDG